MNFERRLEIIDLLNSIENKELHNQLIYKKSNYWVVLKMKLFLDIFSNNLPKSKSSESLFNDFDLKFIFNFFTSKSNSSKQLYCLDTHFRQEMDGKYVNKFFNQFIEKANNNFLFLEYGSSNKKYRVNVDYPSQTKYLYEWKILLMIKRNILLLFFKPKPNLNFNEIVSIINSKEAYTKLNSFEFQKQLIYLNDLRILFKIFLKRHKIEEVFLCGYYNTEMFAMIWACKDLNIKTSDIQHGGQGKMHVAYSDFNLKKNEVDFLPNVFLCWDDESANHIKKWSIKHEDIKVKVTGNLWINYCKKTYNTKEQDKGVFRILFTLQPLNSILIDQYVIDTIKKSPATIQWWIRLHPRQTNLIDDLNLILKNNEISNVIIEEATYMPLPQVFSLVNLHISKFSGSIIEASQMNVKTIIIDEIGVQSFQEIINSNFAVSELSRNSDSLLDLIDTFVNKNNTQ